MIVNPLLIVKSLDSPLISSFSPAPVVIPVPVTSEVPVTSSPH